MKMKLNQKKEKEEKKKELKCTKIICKYTACTSKN